MLKINLFIVSATTAGCATGAFLQWLGIFN